MFSEWYLSLVWLNSLLRFESEQCRQCFRVYISCRESMEIYLSIVNLGWHCSFSEIKKCIISANMQFFKKMPTWILENIGMIFLNCVNVLSL